MSHDSGRKVMHGRDRENNRGWNLQDNTGRDMPQPRAQSLRDPKRRSTLAASVTDMSTIDDSILNEIYNLPDASEFLDTSQSQKDDYSDHFAPPNFQREQSNQGSYNEAPSLPLALQYPPGMAMRSQMAHPSLSSPSSKVPENLLTTEERIGSEALHLTGSQSKHIEDYKKKAVSLRKELETLKEQRSELRGDGMRSLSPDTKRFLKDNTKLQLETQKKLKNINDVMKVLNSIIGEESQEKQESDGPPDQKCKSRSSPNKKINYAFYDPEMHWCRVCDVFPATATDYLNHLHSPEHQQNAAQHIEAPWHALPGLNEAYPVFASAPTKRTPIKGLQFFVPTTAWYCKLCDQFMGDLHCASAHIKSVKHSKNYTNFVEQNPHWEPDWMSDRQKAFEQAQTVIKLKPAKENASCSFKYTAHTVTISKDFQNQRQQDSADSDAAEKKKCEKKRKERDISLSSISDSSSESSKEKKSKKKKPKAIDMIDNKDLEEWVTRIKKRVINRKQRQRSTSQDRERIREMQRKIRESESRGSHLHGHRDGSRDGRGGSRDSRDRRDGSRDSRDRRDNGRVRGDDRQDWRGENRDRRLVTRDSGDERLDRREENGKSERERDKSVDSRYQAELRELKEMLSPPMLALPPPPLALPPHSLAFPPPSLALPTALGAAQPPHQPPAPPLLPSPGDIPSVPKEFQDALELIFPTDPEKCNEMLQQQGLFGPMPQQTSLLGMPPGLPPGLGLPYGHMGLLPGGYGYGSGGMFPPPLLNAYMMQAQRGARRARPPRPAPAPEKP